MLTTLNPLNLEILCRNIEVTIAAYCNQIPYINPDIMFPIQQLCFIKPQAF